MNASNAIILTASLARASGQDAANRQMHRANRTRWNRADFNLAAVTTARLLLHVTVEQGGLAGLDLTPDMLDDLGLTEAEVRRAAS